MGSNREGQVGVGFLEYRNDIGQGSIPFIKLTFYQNAIILHYLVGLNVIKFFLEIKLAFFVIGLVKFISAQAELNCFVIGCFLKAMMNSLVQHLP